MDRNADARAGWAIKEIVGSIRRITHTVYLESKKMKKQFDITGPQSLLLSALAAGGPMASSELSRILFVTPANVTYVVDKLQAKNLVQRKKKHGDRRVQLIELTQDGLELSKTLPDPLEEKLISGLAYMGAEEVMNIYSAINIVVNLIDAPEVSELPLQTGSAPGNDY